MPTPQQDQRYFQAGIQELKEYLLSKTLYWPLSAPMPRLTIGGLLLAQKRLQTHEDGSIHLDAQLDAMRTKWRVAWEGKASQEFGARFDLWKNYLADYRAEPARYAEYYVHEIRWRVMLILLQGELSSNPPETEILIALDKMLRAKFVSNDFIWDKDLEAGFPQDDFWFLYGNLKS